MTVNIESIEIILESESTSRSPGIPVLALNAMSVIQIFEWTGDVSFMLVRVCTGIQYLFLFFFPTAYHNWKLKL